MQLPPDPWSYAIGLFEGCGWVTVNQSKGHQHKYVHLALSMSVPEPLEMFQQIVGGRLNGPYLRRGGGVVPDGNYRLRYIHHLARRAEIDAFLERAYPFLSPDKQEKVLINMAVDTRDPKWVAP